MVEKNNFSGKVTALDITKEIWRPSPLKAVRESSEIEIEISEKTPHNVGKSQKLSNGKGEMDADIGESGFLIYGPYIPLAPDSYQVIFSMIVKGTPSDEKAYAIIDINLTTQGSLISKELFLKEPVEKQKYFLEFDVDEHSGPKDLYETRVIVKTMQKSVLVRLRSTGFEKITTSMIFK